MKKIVAFLTVLCGCCIFLFSGTATAATAKAPDRDYQRIVVLSDAHYPSKTLATKNPEKRQSRVDNKLKTAQQVNSWNDVNLVVFTGDMVQLSGNKQNYVWAKQFVDKVKKPKAIIAGNHEYFFADQEDAKGKMKHSSLMEQQVKLQRFLKTYNMADLYYTKDMGNYLLVFLSPTVASGQYSCEMNAKEMDWLAKTLQSNKNKPTLIFFHAPLQGTLLQYNKSVNTAKAIAQPAEELENVLLANPQVILWVSGHTHTKATNPSFDNPVNWYHGQILDVHNPTLDGDTIWTNSLYLYPDKIVIKTFNHATGTFMDNLTRTVDVAKIMKKAATEQAA